MPELPEIETIKNSLQELVGFRITRIDIMRNDIIRQRDFRPEDIYLYPVAKISRRGKYLIFSFHDLRHLIMHLGMSGRVFLQDSDASKTEKHVHLVMHTESGKTLFYQDARRFGGVWFVINIKEFFSRLGIEPLSEEFGPDYLERIVRGRKIAVKSLLLIQNLISGIGNIYADEALFEAGINPNRPAQSLTGEEIRNLCRGIKKVLQKSIQHRGTTFRDYRDGFNQPGSYQLQLNVYGKINQACPVCTGIIRREKIGGRSSFFCPNCQR